MQIILLRNLKREYAAEFGEKAAFLGELSSSYSVPIGFVITPASFSYFLKETNSELKINKLLAQLQQVPLSDKAQLQEIANQIQKEIVLKEMPTELKNSILEYYNSINIEGDIDLHTFLATDNHPFVAVRNSPIISARKQKLHLSQINVHGEDKLLKSIQIVWASMFTAKSLYYRKLKSIDNFSQSIVVQKMINPEFSGLARSAARETMSLNQKQIEVSYCHGLYQAVAQGLVQPNHFVADKETGKIISESTRKQEIQLTCNDKETGTIKQVLQLQNEEEKLTGAMLNKLFSIIRRIEKQFQATIQIEFAVKNAEIYVLDVFKI